uniref:Ribulose-1,5-bisphosphate carboxylase/oxygenase large subunit n=1 Tax=Anisakis simplex TaxID=6269 RepID=A0A0M3JKY0_ANISI
LVEEVAKLNDALEKEKKLSAEKGFKRSLLLPFLECNRDVRRIMEANV